MSAEMRLPQRGRTVQRCSHQLARSVPPLDRWRMAGITPTPPERRGRGRPGCGIVPERG
jgi:hypothetical protein